MNTYKYLLKNITSKKKHYQVETRIVRRQLKVLLQREME